MAESEIPRVAMCVLRVESRGAEGILITVTTSSDISVTAPGRTRAVAGTEEALGLVAEFLREYQENTCR
jgi:hypothetical protein